MAHLLEKKSVVCIGGSSGMGRGIAEAAIGVGASVTIVARSMEKTAAVAAELGCKSAVADLSDQASIVQLFKRIGRFDHLAITAGAIGRSSFSETPPGEAEQFMQGKVWGTHQCIWHAKKCMNPAGSITLITGGYAQAIEDQAGHVHVAFKATEAMAQVAAVSLAPIRCNVLRPGFIDSDMWANLSPDERTVLRETERNRTLTGCLVAPIDLGRFAVALMQAPAITGAIIPVDGGRHLTLESI